jgi:hypothetical protein
MRFILDINLRKMLGNEKMLPNAALSFAHSLSTNAVGRIALPTALGLRHGNQVNIVGIVFALWE